MHLALASNTSNPAFTPEQFTPNYQRSVYSSLRKLLKDRFKLLEQSLSKLDPEVREFAKKVLATEDKILDCFSEFYRENDLDFLLSWADQWQHYVSRFYLGAYLEKMGRGSQLSPEDEILIKTFLLE